MTDGPFMLCTECGRETSDPVEAVTEMFPELRRRAPRRRMKLIGDLCASWRCPSCLTAAYQREGITDD